MGPLVSRARLDASTVVVVALIVGVTMAALACYFAVAIARHGGSKQARSMQTASLVMLIVSLLVAAAFQLLIWNVN